MLHWSEYNVYFFILYVTFVGSRGNEQFCTREEQFSRMYEF